MSGPYAAYVIAAYAIAFGAVVALMVWVWVERRAAERELARAERAEARLAGGRR